MLQRIEIIISFCNNTHISHMHTVPNSQLTCGCLLLRLSVTSVLYVTQSSGGEVEVDESGKPVRRGKVATRGKSQKKRNDAPAPVKKGEVRTRHMSPTVECHLSHVTSWARVASLSHRHNCSNPSAAVYVFPIALPLRRDMRNAVHC